MIEDERPRLRVLLDHFGLVADEREQWRVAYPLPEVLLLVVCGTIGACDDFDEIVEWGEDNLPFLRRFLPYRHGIPGSRWLRILLNRINPALFSDCFISWASTLPPAARNARTASPLVRSATSTLGRWPPARDGTGRAQSSASGIGARPGGSRRHPDRYQLSWAGRPVR